MEFISLGTRGTLYFRAWSSPGSEMRYTRLLPVLIAVAVLAPFAVADQQLLTWNGGTGSWANSSGWTPAIVPNNNGTSTYAVTIDGGNAAQSTVSLGDTSTRPAYTIDAL